MKRRSSFSSILALAAAILLVASGNFGAAPAAAQKKAAPAAAPAKAPASGALDERIRQLEDRIQDLQTVIGTLQSFVRKDVAAPAQGEFPSPGGQGGSTGGGPPSEVSIRVLALETQIRALTGQMARITERIARLESGAGTLPPDAAQQPLPETPTPPGQNLGALPVNPLAPGQSALSAPGNGAPAPQFGTTASPPRAANPFDLVPGSSAPAPAQALPPDTQFPPIAGLPGGGEGPRAMYDASYQYFLRNDFGAAENGFRSFISTYPSDQLAGNAYYWLGRTHFARKQFEPAAKAFLAGYKKDKKSAIAPDSLLHLGLSLKQLGEKDAACSTLAAVAKQYPDASKQLKQDAAAAIKSGRC